MVHLIDKDALVAEMERLYNLEYTNDSNLSCGKKIILRYILSFLDTLEVKNLEESKNQEWSAEDERNLNVVLSFIDDDIVMRFYLILRNMY